jgi:hypothetical protein
MSGLTVKNWKKFQHYLKRKPPWIKLHRVLLEDYQFYCLPVASKALAPCLWLLAAEFENGQIPLSDDEIAYRLHMSPDEFAQGIIPLLKSEFFFRIKDTRTLRKHNASMMLADCTQHATPREEQRTEYREEKEERVTAEAVSPSSAYAFESGVIRLTAKDLQKWKAAFGHLNLEAELLSLTEWADQQSKWFFAVSGALAKRNREMGLREKTARKEQANGANNPLKHHRYSRPIM